MVFGFGQKERTKEKKAKLLLVNHDRCPQDHPCPAVKVCPVSALTQSGHKAPVANQDTCIRCAKCVNFCPMQALTLE